MLRDRPPTKAEMLCNVSILVRRGVVSGSYDERGHELVCLQFGVELTRMGSATLRQDSTTHCLRMDVRADGGGRDPPRGYGDVPIMC